MWNDRDAPIAYLITFRCYGTWLHGDERGSINRFNNQYQTPYLEANRIWEDRNKAKLKSAAVLLDSKQRQIVETTIREVCEFRNWLLHAINVRTNHVHTVVSTGNHSADSALNAFKAYSTRKGSKRFLWNEQSLERAIEYVVSGQGGSLA